jgi:DNA-binding NarL/FixJ family response regulator
MAAPDGVTHPSGMRVSVLIVDDDKNFVRAATELLRLRGYNVLGHASSGEQAVGRAAELEPDAILLDVHLPDRDGVDLAGQLSRQQQAPNVLLTSTDGRAVDDDLVLSCAAAGFVPKADLPTADLAAYLKG